MSYLENDDDDLQNYSLRLINIKQLFQFLRPYLRWVFIAICFMFVSVVIGITFPLITKVAIDRYIICTYQLCENKPGSEQFLSQISHSVQTIPLTEHKTAILSTSLKKLDPQQVLQFIDNEKYYLFPQHAPLQEYNAQHIGEYWLITEENLRKVPPKILFSLRGSDWHGVLLLACAGLFLIFINFFTEYFQTYFSAKAAQSTMIDLRGKVFSHIESLSLEYFNKQPIGRLVTRVTNDVNALDELLTTVLIQSWRDIFILLGTVFILFTLNWKLALCVTITVPIFIVVTFLFQKKLQGIYRQSRHLLSSLNAYLAEDISGFKIIKIFQQGARRQRNYNHINKQYFKSTFREIKWFGFFRPSVEVICAIGLTIVFIYGGTLAIGGTLSIGAFYIFITYVEKMFKPLAAMVDKYNIMLSAAAAAERLITVLNEKTTINEIASSSNPLSIKGKISIDDVSFSYIANQPVLKHIQLEIPIGKSIAIVGPTGSGKSSIINLLCRFYDADEGQILIDDYPIQSYSFQDLRKNIAIVLQESFIFSRSIRDNLTMGDNFDQKEIEKATELLQIDKFIQTLPLQYETIMEERGATLSAGQRQLLCFARALLHNPKILILDEATSNIDPETEELIQQAIEKLMQHRTCIIVAHRLSTIRKADQIIVLDGGQIIEKGTHEELIAQRGAYYNLYLLQYQNQK